MPDAAPKPSPPYEPLRPRHFLEALAQILIISALAVLLATVIRLPACPAKEPAHAWQR